MMKKIIGFIFLVGIVLLGLQLYSDGSLPIDINYTIGDGSSKNTITNNGIASDSVVELSYGFNVRVDYPARSENYNFTVKVNVKNHNASAICYEYTITSISSGDTEFIKSYMYGFQGYHWEGEQICASLDPNDTRIGRFLTTPTITETYTIDNPNGNGTVTFTNGILQNVHYEYTVEENNTLIPVTLDITLENFS